MKKIIINGRFLLHNVTGVERYARQILFEIDKMIEPGNIKMAIPPDVSDLPNYENIEVVKVGRLKNRLWEHISFPLYVIKQKALSLNLCNVAPLLRPDIVCIHDVRVKTTPDSFNRKFVLWYKLLFFNETKRSKRIITVSNFSKKEIMKYYAVDSAKIDVIYNSWQHYYNIEYDDMALVKYSLKPEKYFFSMCSLEPNKNFRWIAEVAKRNPQKTFVIAGSINKKIFSNGLGFECPQNMKLIGYISDQEAKTLMRYSEAFIFPTFYEGFGIPPLEAVCAGAKRLVVSDIEVMHEIFGDYVNYIDPYDYEFSFSDLKEIDEKENILNKFSWNESAQQIINLLEEV